LQPTSEQWVHSKLCDWQRQLLGPLAAEASVRPSIKEKQNGFMGTILKRVTPFGTPGTRTDISVWCGLGFHCYCEIGWCPAIASRLSGNFE
jgi:hypothetical protein